MTVGICHHVIANNPIRNGPWRIVNPQRIATFQIVLIIAVVGLLRLEHAHIMRRDILFLIREEVGTKRHQGVGFFSQGIGTELDFGHDTPTELGRNDLVARLLRKGAASLGKHPPSIRCHKPMLGQNAVRGVVRMPLRFKPLARDIQPLEIIREKIKLVPRYIQPLGSHPILVGQREAKVAIHELLRQRNTPPRKDVSEPLPRLGYPSPAPPRRKSGCGNLATLVDQTKRSTALIRKRTHRRKYAAPHVICRLGNNVIAVHERKPHLAATASFPRPSATPVHVTCKALLQAPLIHKPNSAGLLSCQEACFNQRIDTPLRNSEHRRSLTNGLHRSTTHRESKTVPSSE